MRGREGDLALVNGLNAPAIQASAGTLERWRVLNASPSRYYRLALDGHRLQVIGTDGGRLAAPGPVDELLLAPGERTEVLVTPTKAARGSPGMGGGGGSTSSTGEQVLATMVVTGSGMGGGGMMSFTVNGESFDPNRTNIDVRVGDTEDWVITNTSSMDHPFHLHAWPFRVIDRTSGPPDVPGWKDTVNVPT